MKTPFLSISAIPVALLAAAAIGPAGSHAATLALYTFPSNNVVSADSFDAGLTAGNVNATGSSGEFLTLSGYHVVNPPTNLNDTAAALRDVVDSSEQNALNNSNFFQFTLTPGASNLIDFDTLSFDWRRGGATQTRSWAAYLSTDGFASGGEANGFTTNSIRLGGVSPTPADTDWRSTNLAINLDGTAAATTFRFYVWTGGLGSGNYDIRFDNILVTGTVIPEPATMALAASGLALLALGRRRIHARKRGA